MHINCRFIGIDKTFAINQKILLYFDLEATHTRAVWISVIIDITGYHFFPVLAHDTPHASVSLIS